MGVCERPSSTSPSPTLEIPIMIYRAHRYGPDYRRAGRVLDPTVMRPGIACMPLGLRRVAPRLWRGWRLGIGDARTPMEPASPPPAPKKKDMTLRMRAISGPWRTGLSKLVIRGDA